jgi:hypothetical protein
VVGSTGGELSVHSGRAASKIPVLYKGINRDVCMVGLLDRYLKSVSRKSLVTGFVFFHLTRQKTGNLISNSGDIKAWGKQRY